MNYKSIMLSEKKNSLKDYILHDSNNVGIPENAKVDGQQPDWWLARAGGGRRD